MSNRFTRFLGLIGVELVVIVAIHLVFAQLEAEQSQSAASLVGSLLRNESTMSQSYLLAQSIEDMQSYGAVRCAKLSKTENNLEAVFYDSTFKPDCPIRRLRTVRLAGLDGHQWQFQLVPNLGVSFYVIKWMTLVAATLLLLLAYVVATRIYSRQSSRLQTIETRRRFLEELNEQVRHDVASPISALRMVAERAPLDSETKAFLREAVNRTSGIFQSLHNPLRCSERFVLRSELNLLVKEKQLQYESFPIVQLDVPFIELFIDRVEFARMVSNLLDNARDAGAARIDIRAVESGDYIQLFFADDGVPIPPEVAGRLGSRGNTLGKRSGSGLGLYQSYRFMQSLGGTLSILSHEGEKFVLQFPMSDNLPVTNRFSKTVSKRDAN